MTYIARESSIQDGQPIYLYQFVQGDRVWRYTSAPADFTWNGEVWLASSISHTEVTQSGEMNKDSLSLKFPRTNEFALQFLGYMPDVVTVVTIWRGHTTDGDGEFRVYWKGRVASSKAPVGSITLECESIFTSMRRPGLRARYQRICRHPLYGRGCNLDMENFGFLTAATAASGNAVLVPGAALRPDGRYNGGMLKSKDGSLRLIVRHVGAQLTLSRDIPSLKEEIAAYGYGKRYGEYYGGVPVTIYPGCAHNMADCDGEFDNLDNMGGFPWVGKGRNPFGGTSIL